MASCALIVNKADHIGTVSPVPVTVSADIPKPIAAPVAEVPLVNNVDPFDKTGHYLPNFETLNETRVNKTYVYCDRDKYASIVIDAITGEILYARNEKKKIFPASMIKLMTLFRVYEEIEQGRLKRSDRLFVEAVDPRSNIAMLKVNEDDYFTVDMALKGIVTRSAADATDVLAKNISGSITDFVKTENQCAQALDMNVHITNTSGVHDDDQYGTVEAIAKGTRKLQQYFPEQCAKDFLIDEFIFHDIIVKQHWRTGTADMGKTGYTDQSGYNTVLSYPDGNNRYIIVVAGGKSAAARDKHANDLFERAKEMRALYPNQLMPEQVNHTAVYRNLPRKLDINKLGLATAKEDKIQWPSMKDLSRPAGGNYTAAKAIKPQLP